MIASLLAVLLLAAPARAASTRVEVDAAAVVPRVTPLSAPLSAPAARLTVAPGITAAPAYAPTPLAAAMAAPAPLAAPVAMTAPAPVLTALPAASIPENRPEAAKPAADTPAYKSRIQAFLSRIANPFGTKAAAEAPPASEAERLDQDFAALDVWSQVAPAARAEIERLRAEKTSKADLKEYVRREAAAAFERVKAARGTKNIAFHYNLHGGARAGYVGQGIRASKGDIALRYSMNGDTNDKVYFFQTAQHDPYTALDAGNGEILFFPSRMGSTLSVFALDAPELTAAMADGRIANAGAISMDFHKGMRGVPYSAFLAPPLPVFDRVAKKLGLKKLSRDEETLATVRYLEAALMAGGAFVPRN